MNWWSKRGAWLSLLFAVSCSYECNQFTCATGCCEDNRCYEGKGAHNGVLCVNVSVTGSGGGGFGGTGGGHSGTGGGSTTACVDYGDPCNAFNRCCNQTSGTYNLLCKEERCRFCLNPLEDCQPGSTSTTCCPGTSCLLRAGFTSIYECR